LVCFVVASGAKAQSKTDAGWPTYGNDAGGTRYSAAAQIDRRNVDKLKVAWTYRTGALEQSKRLIRKAAFEATPILVDGKLFLSTPYNHVIALDPATGTINGRAVFHNPDRRLTPGLFVRLRLPGTATYRGVLVEDRAVGTDLDRRYVLVVGADKKIESRTVTLGPLVDGLRVVRQGLKEGELIVVNGLQRVRPGMPVSAKVVEMGGAL